MPSVAAITLATPSLLPGQQRTGALRREVAVDHAHDEHHPGQQHQHLGRVVKEKLQRPAQVAGAVHRQLGATSASARLPCRRPRRRAPPRSSGSSTVWRATRRRSASGVARHREQPGAGVVQLAKALALAQRFQEQVLQQVVGLCSVAGALAQPAAQFGSVLFPGDGQAVHGVQS
jgi:hypothetical protein